MVTLIIVVAFDATLARLRAECEALRAVIYGGYSVPRCYWDYGQDQTDITGMALMTPPYSSRYAAIDDMLSVR